MAKDEVFKSGIYLAAALEGLDDFSRSSPEWLHHPSLDVERLHNEHSLELGILFLRWRATHM